jgi:hypothetical protein
MNTLTKVLLALTGLALAATPRPAGAEQAGSAPQKGAGAADARAEVSAKSMLRPITWGMELPPKKAMGQTLALAPALAARGGRAQLDRRGAGPAEVVIDVLVAYTAKAAGHYYEIEREVVDVAMAEANHSFRLSGIGHVRLRLAHAFQIDYAEDGGHFDHVWRLADKDDGYMERVHALREAYRADVAILIVDDPKGCGLATRVGADAEDAFAVVHHACAAANYTIAHETGHLIGARHELSYVAGGKWRDIMAYKETCGDCPRLPVWSNPLVLIGGEPAGTRELNNARIIADNAWRVASFR